MYRLVTYNDENQNPEHVDDDEALSGAFLVCIYIYIYIYKFTSD